MSKLLSMKLLCRATVICLLTVSCVAFGCGKSFDDNRAEVHGTVSMDGEPVEKGSITFFPAGGLDGPVAGGEIIDGKYHIDREKGVWIGRNRIELYGVKRTGRMTDGRFSHMPETIEVVEVFPPQYNIDSTLFRDVEAGRVNEINFDLTTTGN